MVMVTVHHMFPCSPTQSNSIPIHSPCDSKSYCVKVLVQSWSSHHDSILKPPGKANTYPIQFAPTHSSNIPPGQPPSLLTYTGLSLHPGLIPPQELVYYFLLVSPSSSRCHHKHNHQPSDSNHHCPFLVLLL